MLCCESNQQLLSYDIINFIIALHNVVLTFHCPFKSLNMVIKKTTTKQINKSIKDTAFDSGSGVLSLFYVR